MQPLEQTPDVERSKRVGGKLTEIVQARVRSNSLQLPTLPIVALQCIELLNDTQHNFRLVAELLGQDPLMAAQVLKAANAAAYGATGRVKTLEQAVGRLGERALRMKLVELSARQVFKSKSRRIRELFQGLWEHSLAVAQLANDIAVRSRQGIEPDAVYLAGLLHDAGKPIVGGLLLEAEKILDARDIPFMGPETWLKVVDGTHRDVGVAVAEGWKLPKEAVRAIANCRCYDGRDPHSATNYVCFANAYAKVLGFYLGERANGTAEGLVAEGQRLLGLDEMVLQTMATSLQEKFKPAAKAGGHAAAAR